MRSLFRLCFSRGGESQNSHENEYNPPWDNKDYSQAAELLRVTSILNRFIKHRHDPEPHSPAHEFTTGSYQKGRDKIKDEKLRDDYANITSRGVDYLFQETKSSFDDKAHFLQYLKFILKKDYKYEINFFIYFILTIYDEDTICPEPCRLKRRRPEKMEDMKDDLDQIINLALIQHKITELSSKKFSSSQDFRIFIQRISIRALLVEGGVSSISALMKKTSEILEKRVNNADNNDEINHEVRLILKNPPTALRESLAKKRMCLCWKDMGHQCSSILSHPLFVGVVSAFLGGVVTYYCTPQNNKICPEYCISNSPADYFTFFSIKEELCNISTSVLENWCTQNCTGLRS